MAAAVVLVWRRDPLNGRLYQAELPQGSTVRELLPSAGSGPSCCDFYVTCNGRRVSRDEELQDGLAYSVEPRLRGGKGGFGSMLRALGAQIEKTTNREACRDLSGRRLRDVNHEKAMAEWIKKQAEREAEKEQRRLERLKRKLEEPKHFFSDPEYHRQRSDMSERLEDSVIKGLQASSSTVVSPESSDCRKRKKETTSGKEKSRKKFLWTGVEGLEVSSSSDSGSDSDSESPSTSESGRSTEQRLQSSESDSDEQPQCSTSTSASSQQSPEPSSSNVNDETPSNSSNVNDETPSNSSNVNQQAPANSSNVNDETPGNSSNVNDETPGNSSNVNDETPGNSSNVNQQAPGNSSNVNDETPGNSSNVNDETPGNCSNVNQQAPSNEQPVSDSDQTEPIKGDVDHEEPVSDSGQREHTESVLEPEKQNITPDPPMETSSTDSAPFDLTSFSSAAELEALGLEKLKTELMALGLKCGGTLQERAARLFSVRGLSRERIDPTLFAKPVKAKKR